MPDAIVPTGASSAAPRASAAGGFGDQVGADTFLKLLVAQLKYQDPTNPSDGTEFLAQTAQFTMVEKLTEIADLSESNSISSTNLAAASLVGRSVRWLEPDGSTGEGVVSTARFGSAGPVLVVGDREVDFGAVAAVTTAQTTKPTTPNQ